MIMSSEMQVLQTTQKVRKYRHNYTYCRINTSNKVSM